MIEARTLLAEYVRNGSETAFRELVTRFINLVYSTALRLVGADTHFAEDVAQTVFVHLARKAHTLSDDAALGGWLHRDTCHVAATLMRGERRRQSRERQAVEMNALQDHSEANLAQVTPFLDEAIDQLGAEDRLAILLRFFEQSDLRSIGQALGTSENAAQKRVSRALDELRVLLKHRGVSLSAAALGTALATQAVSAVPAGLAISIAGTALASAAADSGVTISLFKIMAMTKIKLGIFGALVVAGVAVSVWQHQKNAPLKAENRPLGQQSVQSEMLREEQKVLLGTIWGHALLKFADKNDGQMPPNLAAAAPYLHNNERLPMNWRNVDQISADAATNGIKADQFELLYQGSLKKVQEPQRTVLMREKKPFHAAGGRWARVYVYANGYGSTHWSDDGNFTSVENEGALQQRSP